jgi:hypothetical protein
VGKEVDGVDDDVYVEERSKASANVRAIRTSSSADDVEGDWIFANKGVAVERWTGIPPKEEDVKRNGFPFRCAIRTRKKGKPVPDPER